MLSVIRKRIDRELKKLTREMETQYGLLGICPPLYNAIENFVLREGKRVRPILFVLGYLGYAGKTPYNLYRSAVSLELLHDFMLVHDDIIDKSDTRRGKPSLHRYLDRYLKAGSTIKFSGTDLAIIAGDVMYALALHAFLAVREDPLRKEAAFRKLIEAALYTGSGEFLEIFYGIQPLEKVRKADIDKIYDLKTANYTFASPLTIGATLAGAPAAGIGKLFDYGIYLGRAFQIKDDIIGLFGDEKKTGKSNLTDLQEAKKTMLIWYAVRHGGSQTAKQVNAVMNKPVLTRTDLKTVRRLIRDSGALDYARREIRRLIESAESLQAKLRMRPLYLRALTRYVRGLLRTD